MPPGRYARRSLAEQAEIDARRRVRTTTLNSGLSSGQVFEIIEELLTRQRRELTHIGFYAIWQKFLELGGEPCNRLLGSKLAQGYYGPFLTNDADAPLEILPQGIHPIELGKRFIAVRYGVMRLFFEAKNMRTWQMMSDSVRVAEAYAAKAIFDLGYEVGLAQGQGSLPSPKHRPGYAGCLCGECLVAKDSHPGMRRLLDYVDQELK